MKNFKRTTDNGQPTNAFVATVALSVVGFQFCIGGGF
jgi:amino acid permease